MIVDIKGLALVERSKVEELQDAVDPRVPEEGKRNGFGVSLDWHRDIHLFADEVGQQFNLFELYIVVLVLLAFKADNMVRALKVFRPELGV